MTDVLSGAGWAVVLLGALLALFGAGSVLRPKRETQRKVPTAPPKPDLAPLYMAEAVADAKAVELADEVSDALDPADGSDNPHGLAAAVNRRRR